MAGDDQRPRKPRSDEAFERLYRAHRRAVYRFVLRDLGDPQEAEDVTQIAFLDAYRALSRGSRPDALRPWLYTIARNASRRRFRRQQLEEVPLEDAVPVVDPAEAQAAAREIVAAVLMLSRRHREVLLLREVHGLTAAETARKLHASVASVEMALFRARRELRVALERAGLAPEESNMPTLVVWLLPGRLLRLGMLASPAVTASSVGVFGLGALVVALGGASGATARVDRILPVQPAAVAPAGHTRAGQRAQTSRRERPVVEPLVLVPVPADHAPATNPDADTASAQADATHPVAGAQPAPAPTRPIVPLRPGTAVRSVVLPPVSLPQAKPPSLPSLPAPEAPQLPAPPIAVPPPPTVPAAPVPPSVQLRP